MASRVKGLGWKVVLAVAAISAAGAGEAYAASCKQADLKGDWLVELSTETVCDFKIDKSGSFKNAPCRPQRGSTVRGTATGKLTVDSSCKVGGTMAFKQKSEPTLNISVKATLNKSKDLVSGKATSKFGSATFKGFRQ